ncbi:MAG TPA: hypothetical protein VIU33_04675 [Nitrospiria bacterium]
MGVLVEEARDTETGLLKGLTENYIRVLFDGPDELRNRVVPVQLESPGKAAVQGRIAQKLIF